MRLSIFQGFNPNPCIVFPPDTAEPIRSELFSAERLEQHAETLAAAQRVTALRRADRRLAKRLADNGRVLLEAYRGVEQAVRDERPITPADEWLLDNFYLAQQQIRQIRKDLPREFYRGLPKLAEGPLEGYPRVFGLAWAFVAHTDSRFDRELLLRFVGCVSARPAADHRRTLGRRDHAAHRPHGKPAAIGRADRDAHGLAGRRRTPWPIACSGSAAGRPRRQTRRCADSTRRACRRPSSFDCSNVCAIRTRGSRRRWSGWTERLANEGTTAEAIVREEHQRQVGMNVTVRNIITSMRLISSLDWATIFESMSLVDAVLRAESDFAEMDFPTRDRYRHAIEELARGSGRTELEVAQRAIASARQSSVEREGHRRGTRTRPGLLPHLERTPRAREGHRISHADQRTGWSALLPKRGSSVTSAAIGVVPASSSPCRS